VEHGDEPITGAQRSYLLTLCHEAKDFARRGHISIGHKEKEK
jgi:hypothetical protein